MHGLNKMVGLICALLAGFILISPALASDEGNSSRFFIEAGIEYRVVDIPGIAFGTEVTNLPQPYHRMVVDDFNVNGPGFQGEFGFLLGPGIDDPLPGRNWRFQVNGRYFKGDRSQSVETDNFFSTISIDGNITLGFLFPSENKLDLDTDHREYEIGISVAADFEAFTGLTLSPEIGYVYMNRKTVYRSTIDIDGAIIFFDEIWSAREEVETRYHGVRLALNVVYEIMEGLQVFITPEFAYFGAHARYRGYQDWGDIPLPPVIPEDYNAAYEDDVSCARTGIRGGIAYDWDCFGVRAEGFYEHLGYVPGIVHEDESAALVPFQGESTFLLDTNSDAYGGSLMVTVRF